MKDKICRAFGANVKNYRKLCGLTQEVLAEAVGLEVKSLSLIETGKGFVSAKTLARLAEVLNVDPSDLFETETADEETAKLYEIAQKSLELLKDNASKLRALNAVLKGLI